jgi:hypothetical protein
MTGRGNQISFRPFPMGRRPRIRFGREVISLEYYWDFLENQTIDLFEIVCILLKMGKEEGTNRVDLCKLAILAESALAERAFDKFQKICEQVVLEVQRTGGGEFWFQPEEKRENILKMTIAEIADAYGTDKEKKMSFGKASDVSLEEIIDGGGTAKCLGKYRGIGDKKVEALIVLFRKIGINLLP